MPNTEHSSTPDIATRVARLTAAIPELSTDEVAALYSMWSEDAAVYSEAAGRAMAELLRRLAAEGEGETVTEHFVISRKDPYKSYRWDLAKLLQVSALLAPGEWEQYVEEIPPTRPSYKVNTQKLLAAARRKGGRVKELIEGAYTVEERGTPGVNVHRIRGGENGAAQS